MMKNLIIISIILVAIFMGICVGFASGEGEIVLIEDTAGDIIRPCFDNNYYCSSSFICNLTVTKSTGTTYINNLRMTHNPSYYNLTTTINESGYYNANMVCYNSTDSGKDTFPIVVNSSGGISSIPRVYAQIVGIIIFLVLSLLLLFVAFGINVSPPFKYTAGIIGGLLFFVVLNLSIAILRDEIASTGMIKFFDSFTASSIWIYYFGIGLIFVVWILTIILSVGDAINKKKQKRILGS